MTTDIVERLRELAPGTMLSMQVSDLGALREAADEIERLRGKIRTVLDTFERDEAQGYRSNDRQFAISILKD